MNALWMQKVDSTDEDWHKIALVGPDAMVSACNEPFRGKIRVTLDYPGVGAHPCQACARSPR